jgi:hypothetical protein
MMKELVARMTLVLSIIGLTSAVAEEGGNSALAKELRSCAGMIL